MGPVGTSIGLALKRASLKETEIVGTDGDRGRLANASKLQAVDRTSGNLRTALDGAQLVVVDMPLPEIGPLFEAIGPTLDADCVVTDTGGAKAHVARLAEEHLPDRVGYVGGHPLLRQPTAALEDASASLFESVDYCVVPAKSADREAVRTVIGMVETIGARPFFIDAEEHDTFDAAVRDLPILLSNALVNATSASPSWREMSRLAAQEFRTASHLATYDPQESAASCVSNAETLVRWVDRLIAELYSYRNHLTDGGDELGDSFVRAWEELAKWEAGAGASETGDEVPSAAQTMAGMFVGKRLVDRQRRIRDASKRPPWEYPGRSKGDTLT
jgi:prephenate dehydrogenase